MVVLTSGDELRQVTAEVLAKLLQIFSWILGRMACFDSEFQVLESLNRGRFDQLEELHPDERKGIFIVKSFLKLI